MARAELVGACVLLEYVHELAVQVPPAPHGPITRLPQHGLEPGECFLNRIEVRSKRRKDVPGSVGRLNPVLDYLTLLARPNVPGDDVCSPLLGNQHSCSIGLEPITVERTIGHQKRPCRSCAGRPQRGARAMTAHEAHLALGPAVMAASYVGGRSSLGDEREALEPQIERAVKPLLVLLQELGAVLYGSSLTRDPLTLDCRCNAPLPTEVARSISCTWPRTRIMSPCSALSSSLKPLYASTQPECRALPGNLAIPPAMVKRALRGSGSERWKASSPHRSATRLDELTLQSPPPFSVGSALEQRPRYKSRGWPRRRSGPESTITACPVAHIIGAQRASVTAATTIET